MLDTKVYIPLERLANKDINMTEVFVPERITLEEPISCIHENKKEGIANKPEIFKHRIIRLGLISAASLQVMKVGGYLFEHGVAFYAYAQYAPKTLWGQYFYANATHEAAQKILTTSLFGFSISSVMTCVFSVCAGVIISKSAVIVYNLLADRDKRISITIIEMISGIFSFVFSGTLI